jgi:transcriptional regulator with XRE-family HTH domain
MVYGMLSGHIADNSFSQRIARVMNDNDIDVLQVASALSVSAGSVQGWCAGKSFPKLSNLIALAIFLNIPTEELIELWHQVKSLGDNDYYKHLIAKANFYDLADRDGVQVLGDYAGAGATVLCLCSKGHRCTPRPNDVANGVGWCRVCAGVDTSVAEAKYRKLAKEAGVTLIGEWKNTKTKIEAICPEGHTCYPRPNDISQGVGWCRTCSRRDPGTAEARHREFARLAGVTITGGWNGVDSPLEAICPVGHPCSPRPSSIVRGQGWCKKCSSLNRPRRAHDNL